MPDNKSCEEILVSELAVLAGDVAGGALGGGVGRGCACLICEALCLLLDVDETGT